MIKLTRLLLESISNPTAIFMAGPAGSGKSYLNKQLIPKDFITINVDDTYEELLKKSNVGLKQKDFSPEQLSQASKLMQDAVKLTKDKFSTNSKALKNIVIDSVGASTKNILSKKKELEAVGYKTFMVMVYVSPITALQRNISRDRSLMPSIVLRTWNDVNKNISAYKQAFGDNMVIINNDSDEKPFSKEILKPFFEDSKAIGKPKTPEEQAKREQEREQLYNDIEQKLKVIPTFDSLEQAKQKINQFIK